MSKDASIPKSAGTTFGIVDLISAALLVLLTAVLFYPYTQAPGLALDLYSFLREAFDGVMPWGCFETHRPFRTVTWNIMSFCAGYSKDGYQIMAAVLHLLNSLILYRIVSLFLPGLRILALAAALLRLTYTGAIFESTDDIILEALFPETVSLIAALIFASLHTRQVSGAWKWAGFVSITVLIILSMGMYEQVWANICLYPVVLVLAGCVSLKNRDSILRLCWWYGSVAVFLVYYFLHKYLVEKPDHPRPDTTYFEVWKTLTGILSVESLVQPFKAIGALGPSPLIFLPIALALVAGGVLFWFSTRENLRSKLSSSVVIRVLAIGGLFWILGYGHMVIGLTSRIGNVATWGSRFILCMSYPVAFLTTAILLAVATFFRGRWSAGVFSGLIAIVLFLRCTQFVEGWQSIAERVRHRENIEIALCRTVPSVQPGTVLLIENEGLFPDEPDTFKLMEDIIFTHTRRSLYGTENVYVFFTTKRFPVKESPDGIEIQTEMVYPYSLQPERGYHGIGVDGRHWHPFRWPQLEEFHDDGRKEEPLQWVKVKWENLVWLQYKEDEFQVVEEKSNPELIKGEWNRVMRGVFGEPPQSPLPEGAQSSSGKKKSS